MLFVAMCEWMQVRQKYSLAVVRKAIKTSPARCKAIRDDSHRLLEDVMQFARWMLVSPWNQLQKTRGRSDKDTEDMSLC